VILHTATEGAPPESARDHAFAIGMILAFLGREWPVRRAIRLSRNQCGDCRSLR